MKWLVHVIESVELDMTSNGDSKTKLYYFIDIHLESKQIIGWGIESREEVEVHLTDGYHRLFLSRGQYNKLTSKLPV